MSIPPAAQNFWNAFVASSPSVNVERFYEVFSFGDSEALADTLAKLVLSGVKRGTAGAVWAYEADGQRMPEPGDLSILTNGAGHPLCVIEVTSVSVVPFNLVPASFALIEGEGDGSLAYWRAGHRAFFARECSAAGRDFSDDMLISCEQFKVVYPPTLADAHASISCRT
jgi:uncharacterized protein YhfF